MLSKSPLTVIGKSETSIIAIARELREYHIHLLGATGEGKSKLIEILIADDIGKYPCVLLDPSDQAATMYSVLRHCMAREYYKVCIIDPRDFRKYQAVPAINPLRTVIDKQTRRPDTFYAPGIIAGIMESIRILWQTEDFSRTSKIEYYLPALLTALYAAGGTLADCHYFANLIDYREEKRRILNALPENDTNRRILETAMRKSPTQYENDCGSSIRRVASLSNPIMQMILGSAHHTIDFRDLIRGNFVTLLNLHHAGVYGKAEQRLLATLVLNEFIEAQFRLNKSYTGQKNISYLRPLYIYIDEVGQYANEKITDVLDYHRKAGIRFCLAHQGFSQLKDANVLNSIYRGTHIKIMFHTPDQSDRVKMLRMMYGGQLDVSKVSFNLRALKRAEAIVKIGKDDPKQSDIDWFETPYFSGDAIAEFKNRVYNMHSWYRNPGEINFELDNRFAQRNRQPTGGFTQNAQAGNIQSAGVGAVHDSPPVEPPVDRPARPSGVESYLTQLEERYKISKGLRGDGKDAKKDVGKGGAKKVSRRPKKTPSD